MNVAMKRRTRGAGAVAIAIAAAAAGIVLARQPGTAPTAPAVVAAARPAASATATASATVAPAPSRAVTPPPPPRAHHLKIKKQYQRNDYYCVPASAAMMLATFGINVNQKTLARKMKTRRKGTYYDEARTTINDYLYPRHYVLDTANSVVSNPRTLMARVAYDVGSLHRAPIVLVWPQKLPWVGGTNPKKVGHAVVVYGYDEKNRTISLFDPWPWNGGSHTISAKALAKSLQFAEGIMYVQRI